VKIKIPAKQSYSKFLEKKAKWNGGQGFAPNSLPDWLFDFQSYLVDWALRIGRGAILADCGLGKTPMQLAWANEIVKRENRPVILATPLAVGAQAIKEADKFGVEAERSRDGKHSGKPLIVVTNYQQLHKFNPSDFAGMVCDESSAIKDAKSKTKAAVIEFTRGIQYRLLCSATAAPNDVWELGTSSEALGYLGFRDMVTTFFKQETAKDHLGWGRTKYRFRGHAEQPFWSWVCSWARSLRKPSDLGFDDSRFILPELIETEIVVDQSKARPGMLFAMPGKDIRDERKDRRLSIDERCETAADIVCSHNRPAISWCELNDEGDLLEKIIPNSRQVSGSMSDDEKEEVLLAFTSGELNRIIIKPKIGAWGLNWQHCSDITVFPSHSYEQYYQAIRRCYRFGQKKKVKVSNIISEAEAGIMQSIRRKTAQAEKMFSSIVSHMGDAMHLVSSDYFPNKEVIPSWLS
jgi:hypothetical protein